MVKTLCIVALLVPLVAEATDKERPPPKCTAGEKWTGNDKDLHFVAGATISFATTLGTEKPLWGFAAGTAVGALKELSDRGGNGCSSGKDFGVTVLGAAVGAFAGDRVLVYRNKGTTVVAYRQEF
jgi:uncharacterized protein YfiM (DUF2279 family)